MNTLVFVKIFILAGCTLLFAACSPKIPDSTVETTVVIPRVQKRFISPITKDQGQILVLYSFANSSTTTLVNVETGEELHLEGIYGRSNLLPDGNILLSKDIRTHSSLEDDISLYFIDIQNFSAQKIPFLRSERPSASNYLDAEYLDGLIVLDEQFFIYDRRLFSLQSGTVIPDVSVDYYQRLNNQRPIHIVEPNFRTDTAHGLLSCDINSRQIVLDKRSINHSEELFYEPTPDIFECLKEIFPNLYVRNNDTYIFMADNLTNAGDIVVLEIANRSIEDRIEKIYGSQLKKTQKEQSIFSEKNRLPLTPITVEWSVSMDSVRKYTTPTNFLDYVVIKFYYNGTVVGELYRDNTPILFLGASSDKSELYFFTSEEAGGVERVDLPAIKVN